MDVIKVWKNSFKKIKNKIIIGISLGIVLLAIGILLFNRENIYIWLIPSAIGLALIVSPPYIALKKEYMKKKKK